MKRQFKLLGILLILVFSTFGFARTLIHSANATYVEGAITKDTIWTFLDSPFVVSDDVVVYPNATLTIEPGVEVKFGGNFSLTVEGRLLAIGTTENTVKFTSNKLEPQSGDWKTISFVGIQQSSLTNCVVEYGANGISVENGNVAIENSGISYCQHDGIVVINGELNIQNCNVSLCLENGANLQNSDVTVQDSLITQNGDAGITITGNGHTTVQGNIIVANKDGITLTGNETSGVNISQNIIGANTEDGVLITAVTHSGIIFINNTVSSNKNGLHVSTLTNTYIANNSFSYNEVGILYDQGTHMAKFNDIYGNIMGMNAGLNATVNAQQNYWGDSSGPYHKSLNPTGRGNEVGGDGVNLVFIFFLTKPVGHINVRPIGRLVVDRVLVPLNEAVMFFATGSTDEGHVDSYLFNFDDGGNSGWTTLSVFTHKYSSVGIYHANLTVMDDFGATSEVVEATINVTTLASLHASLDLGKSTVNEGEQVSATIYVTDETTPIPNASITVFPAREGDFTPSSGSTDAAGYFITSITVRDVADITNMRVIARASMNGYADGADYEYLEVLPQLSVLITPDSYSIKSEATTRVRVDVRSNDQPVANAYLTLSSNGGNLSAQAGTTDLYGAFLLNFTAPLTTQFLSITITANAQKDMYIDGVGHGVITVAPKILDVQIDAQPDTLISEAKSNITVHVSYEATPIESANITIAAVNGSLSQTTGLTDINGSIRFVFTSPAVNAQTTITIVANASMRGYADNQNQIILTVNPKTFIIKVEATPNVIESESLTTVIVNVTCKEDGKPVSDAWVTMSSDNGNFAVINKTTGSDGLCSFVFSTPQTSVQMNVTVVANVVKNGFVSNENGTIITVIPKMPLPPEAGFPLLTVLLIVIPIVIVVVVIILIKLKIIAISLKEET